MRPENIAVLSVDTEQLCLDPVFHWQGFIEPPLSQSLDAFHISNPLADEMNTFDLQTAELMAFVKHGKEFSWVFKINK